MLQACGTSVKDYDSENVNGGQEGQVLAVKDMSDMLDFDEYQVLCIIVVSSVGCICSSRGWGGELMSSSNGAPLSPIRLMLHFGNPERLMQYKKPFFSDLEQVPDHCIS